MNRITAMLEGPAGLRDLHEQVRISRRNPVPEPAPQSFFTPMHYEPGYAYPLLVWLHGAGDDESQLTRIMPTISLRNYVAVAPRGNAPHGEGRLARFSWSQARWDVQQAEQRILDSVSEAQDRLNINARRIFIAGFDSGGTMALRLGLTHPDLFAGALSFDGGLPMDGAPLARLEECRELPILMATGQESQRYPAKRVCKDLRLLHTAGMNLSVRQYPGGDDLRMEMLRDVDRWIMELIASGAC